MTQKEKAEELYLKHRAIISEIQFLTGFILMSQAKDLAKKSALIAVDEMMQYAQNAYYNEDIIKSAKLYWQEVKKEIKQL